LQIRGTNYNAKIAEVTVSIKVYLGLNMGQPGQHTWSFEYEIPTKIAYSNAKIIVLPESPISMNQTIVIDSSIEGNYKFAKDANGMLTLTLKTKDILAPTTSSAWEIKGQQFIVKAHDEKHKLIEAALFDIPTTMNPLV
ncbi:MAG: hypothetical protein RSC27_03525, partial [Bacilli bacterium]